MTVYDINDKTFTNISHVILQNINTQIKSHIVNHYEVDNK